MTSYKNIPTNIISGFLGAGKTTAIQHLLTLKPKKEVWAVIVNEFGKIGIDGELLKNDSVEIKQIPGGCLCCVGSQLLSVGLNKIIRTINPQRIIIEPTGLGHPAKLIESLTSDFYDTVLDLKAVINLVDARQLKNTRYMNNQAFIDQSNLADILIASKLDQYTDKDKDAFFQYAMNFQPTKSKVAMIEQGALQLDWLDLKHGDNRIANFSHAHVHNKIDESCEAIDNNTWQMIEGHANGYYSLGWKLENIHIFDQYKLKCFINDLFVNQSIERLKAIVHINDGWLRFNFTQNERDIQSVKTAEYTVLEIVANQSFNAEKIDLDLKSSLE